MLTCYTKNVNDLYTSGTKIIFVRAVFLGDIPFLNSMALIAKNNNKTGRVLKIDFLVQAVDGAIIISSLFFIIYYLNRPPRGLASQRAAAFPSLSP